MTTPTRRSRRERKPNTKYDDQVAWDEVLPLLRAESDTPDQSSSNSTPEAVERRKDPDVADVVMQNGGEEEPDLFREDGDFSAAAESSSVGTPDEEGQSRDVYVSRLAATTHNRNKRTVPRPRMKALAAEQGLRSRMLDEGDGPKLKLSREKVYTYNFGSELVDLHPVIRSRDVWQLNPRDSVLPSRTSMTEALKLERLGIYLQLPQTIEDRTQDLDTTAAQHVQLQLPDHQRTRRLDEEYAARQSFWDVKVFNDVVIGRSYEPRKHELELFRPLNLAEAGHRRETISSFYHNGIFSVLLPRRKARLRSSPAPINVIDSPQIPDNAAPSLAPDAHHQGWLINLGACPQCLAWAPVDSDGQYLAVTLKCTKAQREAAPVSPSKLAPAFSPSANYPSHVQIWRIMALPGDPNSTARFSHDASCAPHLFQRLCFRFGDILQLEWVPQPAQTAISPIRSMVILSSDGNIRLITVDLSANGTFEITEPRLIARPPSHTVFTCFALPSNEVLIAGGADGAIRLHNLHYSSASGELEPYSTVQVHHTYLMSIAVATDLPYYLASTSASGELTLTDLRSPYQDRVRVHKSRLPTRNLSYLPHTRIFLSTSDTSGNSEPHGTSLSTVIGQNLRHFYHSNTIMRLPEAAGVATVLASSPFHPIVMAANAAGSVFTTNVLRRLLPTPKKDENGGGFMMKLCEVDWIPTPKETSKEEPRGSAMPNSEVDHSTDRGKSTHRLILEPPEPLATPNTDVDLFYGADTRSGITRIHELFKPERIELITCSRDFSGIRGKGKNKDQRKAENTPSAASYQIICHEEQAVTAMAWNGNSRFAGWAAIAWGSGVLKIQDLAYGD